MDPRERIKKEDVSVYWSMLDTVRVEMAVMTMDLAAGQSTHTVVAMEELADKMTWDTECLSRQRYEHLRESDNGGNSAHLEKGAGEFWRDKENSYRGNWKMLSRPCD